MPRIICSPQISFWKVVTSLSSRPLSPSCPQASSMRHPLPPIKWSSPLWTTPKVAWRPQFFNQKIFVFQDWFQSSVSLRSQRAHCFFWHWSGLRLGRRFIRLYSSKICFMDERQQETDKIPTEKPFYLSIHHFIFNYRSHIS